MVQDITKSMLIDRVADLAPNKVVLEELKLWLTPLARSDCSTSFYYFLVLEKIRQLELKYKGVKS